MKKKIESAVKWSLLLAGAASLVACGGGGGGGGGSTYGAYQSPSITASQFVSALNSVDGAPLWDQSAIELYADETYRSQVIGEDDWFVIYDAKYDEHKAVSLQYIRSIVYYDYYSNSYGTAREFRDIELNDILAGNTNGDFWGDDYEVVDYDPFSDSYWGRNSGFEYEDETETTDVNLMAMSKEQKQFFTKASNVSFQYNVNIETAFSLVTLGSKVEKMIANGKGALTPADEAALMGDMEKLTGVSMNEIMEAAADSQKKEAVIGKIADKIGTTAQNLESRLLPELFGVNLE
ncbi:MAG: hypothetical protein Fur0010_19030 [Bdellovibrio sp.]